MLRHDRVRGHIRRCGFIDYDFSKHRFSGSLLPFLSAEKQVIPPYGFPGLLIQVSTDGRDYQHSFFTSHKGINDEGEERLALYPADHEGNILETEIKSLGAMGGGGGAADDGAECSPDCPGPG